jgi:4-hydroxy-tetrahydrodipicolinate synthase
MTSPVRSAPERGPQFLTGMIPAIVVPLTTEHDIDTASLKVYADLVSRQGVSGIVINSDAGEVTMLTASQRERALAAVVEAVDGRIPVIAGVPAQATPRAVAEARHAATSGADGLLVFPTPAFQGSAASRTDVVLGYHEAIAESGLPLIAFHLDPALGGTIFSDETLSALASCEAVVAMKEASFDPKTFVHVRDVLRSAPRQVSLLTGNDTFVRESLVLGAHGALLGLGSICTSLQVRLVNAVSTNDLETAGDLGRMVDRLAWATFRPPLRDYRARIKAGLVKLGVFERADVVPPFAPASADDRQAIALVLEQLGRVGEFEPVSARA